MKDFKDSNPGPVGGRDPFADLVRAVEGPGPRSPGVAKPVYAGFEPIEIPQAAGWDEFTYRPEQRADATDAPKPGCVALPVSSGIVDRGPAAVSATRRGSARSAAAVDPQMEDALRGLSQPQRPRDVNPAETQSFAPARELESDAVHPQTLTLDDFDELIASEMATLQTSKPVNEQDDDYALGFDEDDVDIEPYDDYPVRTHSRFRAPAMILGGIAALALVGVASAALYSGMTGGTSGGDGSLLIKADAEPYKIVPVDPGGKSIPNQNKAVYQRVAGVDADRAPTQQSLTTAMEEPLDLSEDAELPVDALPGVSVGEDVSLPADEPTQVADAATSASDATLQPRKVRTLTVRPDGTLVASEAAAVESELMTNASSTVAQAAVMDPVAGIAPALPFAGGEDDQSDMTTASVSLQAAAEPAPVAAPPAKPAAATAPAAAEEQLVAAVVPPAAPVADGGYYVQISSQPSAALAQESMASLGKRFSSVIGGRGVGIKAAEIAGKGTFYRVRVAAASKTEANSLCDSLKSAGGSCFVTR